MIVILSDVLALVWDIARRRINSINNMTVITTTWVSPLVNRRRMIVED